MPARAAPRLVLYPFLAVLLLCGVGGVEAWPFTGWRLFSGLRGPVQRSWTATRTLPGGAEVPIDFAALGRGFTGSLHVMIDLPRRSDAEREAVCKTWLSAVHDRGLRATGVRVYRTKALMRLDDPRPARFERTLFFEC